MKRWGSGTHNGKRYSECASTGKRRFTTEHAAANAAMSLALKGDEPIAKVAALNVYHCTVCGDFHVGHSSAKNWKR